MTNQKRAKIFIVPYPAQGHVTPMVNLASVLALQGFEPVIVTTDFIRGSISNQIRSWTDISFIGIPEGIEEESPRDFFALERTMENVMPVFLENLVEKSRKEEEDGTGGAIACFVVDLLASGAITVGVQCGIPVAGFWPAMVETFHLITAIPEMIRKGFISDTGQFPFIALPLYIFSVHRNIVKKIYLHYFTCIVKFSVITKTIPVLYNFSQNLTYRVILCL